MLSEHIIKLKRPRQKSVDFMPRSFRFIPSYFRSITFKYYPMQGNFLMLQKDDLKQVVAELVEELIGKMPQSDLSPEENDEYYTRDQVCEKLHITYTTLWRMQKEGTVLVHKLGGRNLYSKKEITSLVKSTAALSTTTKSL